MDEGLRAALLAPPEERTFHGVKVLIRHMSANQRLNMAKEFEGANGKIEAGKAVEFSTKLITDYVVGMTPDDAAALCDASFPRVEQLAMLVMEVNGIGASQERLAKN